jgi:hypothetical protein
MPGGTTPSACPTPRLGEVRVRWAEAFVHTVELLRDGSPEVRIAEVREQPTDEAADLVAVADFVRPLELAVAGLLRRIRSKRWRGGPGGALACRGRPA